jgi:hypothetical protein
MEYQSTSGSGQNPRWTPEVSAQRLKSLYLTNRLTDHHEILTAASCHYQKPEKIDLLPVWTKIQNGRRKRV